MASIYAELLSNIRQVSARTSLPSPSDASTRALIVDQGRRLEVHHRGEAASLDLPVRVLAPSAALPLPDAPSKDLGWRLPVPASELEACGRFSAEDQEVPWSSRDVRPGSGLCCRACGDCIVPRDGVRGWKDLPSENWAEMMEFWHCHKPVDHDHDHGHDHDQAGAKEERNGEEQQQQQQQGLAKRGYGANSAITAQTGVGFVDLTSFMVSESDCQNLLFSSTTRDSHHHSAAAFESSEAALGGADSVTKQTTTTTTVKSLVVSCKSCSAGLGLYNVLSSSVNLFKWQVTCETFAPSRPPSSSECLVATLVATISRSGSSKSVLVPHEAGLLAGVEAGFTSPSQGRTTLLHLWVLNNNVAYTSTGKKGKRTAIKVLYQEVGWEAGMELVDSMTSTVQEVNFPESAIESTRHLLGESNGMLPAAERLFQQWSVALLERWA